ncbi:MAG: hypothetical protein C4K49_11830 [Candidatus Thorarchaeota archaeon]|nr:MAG: hypothetical protein C4K49_11830 [Candidatus Thorarchaeota archaeon]
MQKHSDVNQVGGRLQSLFQSRLERTSKTLTSPTSLQVDLRNYHAVGEEPALIGQMVRDFLILGLAL